MRTEGNLIRTGTLNKMEFREPMKFSIEFLFIRNPDLLGNGRLPLVVQDFKYKRDPAMKRALAFALLMAGSPLDAGEIVQKPLDEFVIYNIPVACQSGNTTVLFPSAISGLYAKSVAVQEQPNADFLLSFTPGNFYFTVRALKKGRRRPPHRHLQQEGLRPASRAPPSSPSTR